MAFDVGTGDNLRNMFYAQLFGWWIASITFNILFVVAASIYLYRIRKHRESGDGLSLGQKIARVARDYMFVWFLLGLLIFYIYSIGQASYLLFLAGNLVVEVLLIAYIYMSSSSSKT